MGGEVELRGLERYSFQEAIGYGRYGRVSLAVDKLTGEQVAIKRIKLVQSEQTLKVREKDGVVDVQAIVAIEIKILRLLKHKNVVRLRDVIYSPDVVHLVFDYIEHDLCGLINSHKFTPSQIKCLIQQLLEGLHYCHLNGILHRDVKSANLLVSCLGILQIADFGMAAPTADELRRMHCKVVTLWYRSPELLLGFDLYGPGVDMWSVACVLAEMLFRKAIFPGKNEEEQLIWIFSVCGTPDETSWPGVSKSPVYRKFMEKHGPKESRLTKAFHNIDPKAMDLLQRLLTLNPAKRISAAEALMSDYLWCPPLACKPSELPFHDRPCTELKSRSLKRTREEGQAVKQPDLRAQQTFKRREKQPRMQDRREHYHQLANDGRF